MLVKSSHASSGVLPHDPARETHCAIHRVAASNAERRRARRSRLSEARDASAEDADVDIVQGPSASVSARITRTTGWSTYSRDRLRTSGGMVVIAADTASRYDACEPGGSSRTASRGFRRTVATAESSDEVHAEAASGNAFGNTGNTPARGFADAEGESMRYTRDATREPMSQLAARIV
jgi:hypothetical protein